MSGLIGIGVVIPGDGFERMSAYKTGIMAPTGGGTLKGAYFLSAVAKQGVLSNYAGSTKPLTKIGNPPSFNAYATCDVNNCFDPGLQLAAGETTIIAIVKPNAFSSTNANQGLPFGDWNDAGTPVGVTADFKVSGGSTIRLDGYATTNNGQEVAGTSITPNGDNFYIILWAFKDGNYAGVAIYNPTSRAFEFGNITFGTTIPSGRNFLIGGHYSTTQFLGEIDVAGLLLYTGEPPVYDTVGQWLYEVQGPQLGMW